MRLPARIVTPTIAAGIPIEGREWVDHRALGLAGSPESFAAVTFRGQRRVDCAALSDCRYAANETSGHGSAHAGTRINPSSQRTMLGNRASGISVMRQSVAIDARWKSAIVRRLQAT
jgi:hypothetical protein